MISRQARPKLASKARLKTDKKTGALLLIYPEAGLKLNATGAEVLRRCDGDRTLQAIVDELCRVYEATGREEIDGEVTGLINQLVDRGLLTVES